MKVNPHAKVRVEAFFGVPVLYVDDFYVDAHAVREIALHSRYDISVARYPGLQALIAPEAMADAMMMIAAIGTKLGDRAFRPEDIYSDFSIVTMGVHDLLPAQLHPHIDPTPLLGLIYLTPGSRAGTSFYFNEILGYAVAETEAQRQAHEAFLERYAAEFPDGNSEINPPRVWRHLYTIEPAFNRFVLFPGNVFHTIDIAQVDDVVDMTAVRLTQRFVVKRTHPK